MNILYSDEFRKQCKKLPPEIRRIYRTQETRFKEDWHDPRLHVKKLSGHPFPFSFRITRSYRVLFTFIESETALFATIGDRKDVYR